MAYANGLVPAKAMRAADTGMYLRRSAARDWFALATEAALAGSPLHLNSANRSKATQVALFTGNYTTTPNGSADVRHWNGHYWYRRPGGVTVAVPGTSNHGFAVAADVGGVSYNYGAAPSRGFSFLEKHAGKHGFTHPSWARSRLYWEPWHWEHLKLHRYSKRLPTMYVSVKKLKSLQHQLGVGEDGVISAPSETVKEMQRRINKNRKAAKIHKPLKVNGLFDEHTIRALRKWLNWKVKPKIRLKNNTKWGKHAEHVLRKSIKKKVW